MNAKPMMACVFAVLLSAPAMGAIVADGNSADWGINPADNNLSDWTPSIPLSASFLEDQDDLAGDGGFVGPNSGGQNYDSEYLAVTTESSNLYLLIVSGQRPDNGFQRYGPGDVRIVTSGGEYGIEIGGGAGGGPGGIVQTGDPGTTYQLQSNGYTSALMATDAAQTAGSVWSNPTWLLDPIPPQQQTQLQIVGGTFAGTATYVYTRDTSTTQHAVMELCVPLTIFGGETILGISWFPACGNDELNVSTEIVPEPSAFVLVVAGIAPLYLLRRARGVVVSRRS